MRAPLGSFPGLLAVLGAAVLGAAPAAPARAAGLARAAGSAAPSAPGAVAVASEAQLRAAWLRPGTRRIELTRDLVLRDCDAGDPIRESATAVELDGGGHTLRQSCFEQRVLRQDGSGAVTLRDLTLTRGGSDGPGAGISSRGEITLIRCRVTQNLSEEPGGGVFSMRRVTVVKSSITGNLANDDGGGVYARRGGVRVVDSVISGNVVDGSGGAIGSTGDVVVVRSHVDGNTTDGDGGGIYADEDGDVTIVDSTVDGNTADGPGGAIFTVDGDVTVVGSALSGNRADDRGGAIAGEADVTVVDSTIARNSANAHVGGGIWARGTLAVTTSTIADNYAEGMGGGVFAAGDVELQFATIAGNIAPLAASVGAGGRLSSLASVIGPARVVDTKGETQPTATNCRVSATRSRGYNVAADASCGLTRRRDAVGAVALAPLALAPAAGVELRLPARGSLPLDRVPAARCMPSPLTAPRVLAALRLSRTQAGRTPAVAHDQRGVPRPQGGACDAGAAELEPAAVTAVAASARIAAMERTADRFELRLSCLSPLPASQQGGAAGGFLYDDRDGSGLSVRPALTLQRGGRATHRLLRLEPGDRCASAPMRVGERAVAAAGDVRARLRRIARVAARFEAFEACLRWVGVTEYGDPGGAFGYLRDVPGAGRGRFASALALDSSRRDDPDYLLLSIDLRERGCRGWPGHGRAGAAAAAARGSDRSAPADALDELEERVGALETFDACAFPLGVAEQPGYRYGAGGRRHRSALALDHGTSGVPPLQLLAFPDEEPPQIECDEDAAGPDDDDDD